jgi:hypothetical protein
MTAHYQGKLWVEVVSSSNLIRNNAKHPPHEITSHVDLAYANKKDTGMP